MFGGYRQTIVCSAAVVIVAGALANVAPGAIAQQCQAVYAGMEVTQAIQHYPAAAVDMVPLVDGRATTARIYFTTSPPGCGPVPNVTGRLRVLDGASILVDIRTPDNRSITVPPDPPGPDREQENDTLNFTFIPKMSSFPPPIDARTLKLA